MVIPQENSLQPKMPTHAARKVLRRSGRVPWVGNGRWSTWRKRGFQQSLSLVEGNVVAALPSELHAYWKCIVPQHGLVDSRYSGTIIVTVTYICMAIVGEDDGKFILFVQVCASDTLAYFVSWKNARFSRWIVQKTVFFCWMFNFLGIGTTHNHPHPPRQTPDFPWRFSPRRCSATCIPSTLGSEANEATCNQLQRVPFCLRRDESDRFVFFWGGGGELDVERFKKVIRKGR